jgi:hypothetical protein
LSTCPSAKGDGVINLGAGDDLFNPEDASGQPHLEITGGPGNDTINPPGAHANPN